MLLNKLTVGLQVLYHLLFCFITKFDERFNFTSKHTFVADMVDLEINSMRNLSGGGIHCCCLRLFDRNIMIEWGGGFA